MSLFQKVNGLKPRKNKFDISAGNAGTLELGELIPVYVNELVPGDKVRINVSSIVRLQPLVAPMLQKLLIKFEAFFVPTRIIDPEFPMFFTGGKDGQNDYSIPLCNQQVNKKTGETEFLPVTFEKYSLADYFGLPVGVEFGGVGDPDNTCTPIAYPFWAYAKIYTDYYIDENCFNDEYSNFDTLKNYFCFNGGPVPRSYKKDYFTSALPFQQRGIPGAFSWDLSEALATAKAQWDSNIPVKSFSARSFAEKLGDTQTASYFSGNAHVVLNYSPYTEMFSPGLSIQPDVWSATPIPTDTLVSGVPKDSFSVRAFGVDERMAPGGDQYKYTRVNDVIYPGLNDNKIVGAGPLNFGFDIADLRYQIQLQKYNERNARGGYRYNEYILSHYGVYTSDRTVDRAEFIGSAKTEISVSEIPQTSATDENSPQGNLAGRALGSMVVNLGTYKACEPGYLMVLQSIVPAASYASQGVGKMWTRRSRMDFYIPEFAHLSEQPILKRELYVSGDISKDNDVFGYQGIYDEYRYKPSIAVADFRDNMSHWKMSREFSNSPELNQDFIMIDGSAAYNTAPFAYQGSDYKHYIYDTYVDVLAFRPLPYTAEPGFVDHF